MDAEIFLSTRDIHKLSFLFDGEMCIFQRLPLCLASPPTICREFMHFSPLAMKKDGSDLYKQTVDGKIVNRDNF